MFGAPKSRPPLGCQPRSLSICLGLGTLQGAIAMHRYAPVCQPAQSRGCPLSFIERHTNPLARYLMLLAVSATPIPKVSPDISRGSVGFQNVPRVH